MEGSNNSIVRTVLRQVKVIAYCQKARTTAVSFINGPEQRIHDFYILLTLLRHNWPEYIVKEKLPTSFDVRVSRAPGNIINYRVLRNRISARSFIIYHGVTLRLDSLHRSELMRLLFQLVASTGKRKAGNSSPLTQCSFIVLCKPVFIQTSGPAERFTAPHQWLRKISRLYPTIEGGTAAIEKFKHCIDANQALRLV